MKIEYLLSGINKEEGFGKTLSNLLRGDIKSDSIITFIASTFNNYQKNDRHYLNAINWFKKINISCKKTYLIDSRVTKEKSYEFIKESDVIFVMGGDTLSQIKSIEEYNLIPYLQKRNGITIGISAGSINMAKNVALARDVDDNIPINSYYDGIGLTNINVEPHFSFLNIEHNKDIFDVSKNNKVVCLPELSFIRKEDGNEEYFGDYYVIENGNII